MSNFTAKAQWMIVCSFAGALVIAVSLGAAFALRFDFDIPPEEMRSLWIGLSLAVPVKLLIFHARQRSALWWQYAGIDDLLRLLKLNILASVCFTILILLIVGRQFPRSIYCLDPLICFLLTSGLVFAGRIRQEMTHATRSAVPPRGLIVYGAGVAGIMLAREVRANPALGYRILGFLDDDVHKHGSTLMGLPVLGGGENAAEAAERFRNTEISVREIVITMPSATRQQIKRALNKCAAAGVPVRVVPGLGELISGKVGLKNTRDLSVTDLLRRDAVALELVEAARQLSGRCVLVTGAAGSIGSELCRQLAKFDIRMLVALDQAESELFRLDWQLREKFPDLNLAIEVGDIRDAGRIEEVMVAYSVDAVFHAAAYKHVPLMERHMIEAVRNNVLGTWNVAEAAYRNRVSMFLMISTDKAVNPTSVMGLTKRAAEIIISGMPQGEGSTRFMSVRFGNVLVSNGSVVPTFQRQIAAGGPVTITHPDIKRYFMTVQEAAQLVLHASAMGSGSEVFVLDMGEPVRIMDLAIDMIRQSGFVPNEDIEIRVVGLRRGEKLFEELSLENEHILPTSHNKIKKFQGARIEAVAARALVRELQELVAERDAIGLLALLKQMVPEYQPENQPEAAAATVGAGLLGVAPTAPRRPLQATDGLQPVYPLTA